MTRYSEIEIAGLQTGTTTPTGDWTIDETGADILAALTTLLGAADAAAVLTVGYIYDFPYAGEFRNVATQHVIDAYTYPRDPDFGYYVEYSGFVARDSGTDNIHIFSCAAPSATHVQLGLVFVVSASTAFPILDDADVGPGEAPAGGGSIWISIPAGPQNIEAVEPFTIGDFTPPAVTPPMVDDPVADPDAMDFPTEPTSSERLYYTVLAFMNSAWRDLTPWVRECNFEWGERHQNEIGHVASPASGALVMDNPAGRFGPISTHASVDALPGPQVRIFEGVSPNRRLLFKGWSVGITADTVAEQPPIATLVMRGALAKIRGQHSELFFKLDSDLLTGAIVGRILDNVQWPSDLRTIGAGTRTLNAVRANKAGVTAGGARKVRDTLGALELMAMAEAGRIYDDWLGHVVFEHERPSDPTDWNLSAGQVTRYRYPLLSESVVNEIVADGADIELTAVQDLQVFTQPFDATDRLRMGVNPGETEEMVLEVDDAQAVYVTDVQDLTAADYTFTRLVGGQALADHTVRVINEGDQIRVRVTNTHATVAGLFSLSNIRGRRAIATLGQGFFQRTLNAATGQQRAIFPLRRPQSVAKFDLRHVDFPAGALFTDRAAVRTHLDSLLDKLDGITSTPIPRMDVTISGVAFPALLVGRVGDRVTVDGFRGVANATQFWIEKVSHNVNRLRGTHSIEWEMTGA